MPKFLISVIKLTSLSLVVLFLSTGLFAAERILSYDSQIQIHKNGAMDVVDTIVVVAEGRDIKRGIYRDFPTDYKDRLGNNYNTTFSVVSVKLGGNNEPHHIERRSNGYRVYVGNKNVFLPSGTYSYQIHYKTNYQLGYFDSHDELYWNVTGNGWSFPIEQVSATVSLPEAVTRDDISVEAYTGSYGAKGQDSISRIISDSTAEYQTTRHLRSNEGLTIVMTWPKGLVAQPTPREKRERFVRDNSYLKVVGFGLLALLAYFLVVWYKFGRDPGPGVIYPRYAPPEGYRPDELRFIKRMGYDNKTFTAALLDMAARGHLKINEDKSFLNRDYSLELLNEPKSSKDSVITENLFDGSRSIDLEDENHAEIRAAMSKHKKRLNKAFKNKYFFTNTGLFVIGVVIALIVAFLSLVTIGNSGNGGNPLLFLSTFIIMFLVCVVFYHLLKAPTLASRKLLDEIEGFSEYMQVAEGEELKHAKSPELTPELFEKYLPYALALGVEQGWAEKFSRVFARLAHEDANYQPSWYNGSSYNFNSMSKFTSSLSSSLSSTISSSSTPPGSSSGSGGGGFSGGGGGGGGGGGW